MKTKGNIVTMRIDAEGKRLDQYEQRDCLWYVYNEDLKEFLVEGKKTKKMARMAYHKLWKQERGM